MVEQENNNTEFQKQFLRRIKLDENRKIGFLDLPEVMRAFAAYVPFENSDVIGQEPLGITKEYLIEKILVKNTGGLCYHLNRLMYYFMCDCGLAPIPLVGTVWDQVKLDRWAPPNGHCINMVQYNGTDYLVDVGFGLFLALAPIPFKSIVASRTGLYRWTPNPTEYGTHRLERKNTPDDDEWILGYAFTLDPITDATINQAQIIIHKDELKTFNVTPLTTMLLEPSQGHATLVGDNYIITKPNGEKVKQSITAEQNQEILNQVFGFK